MRVLSSASSLNQIVATVTSSMLNTLSCALSICNLSWLVMRHFDSIFNQNVVVKVVIYGLHLLRIKALVHVRVLVASSITAHWVAHNRIVRSLLSRDV